jgi:hypothetical protein
VTRSQPNQFDDFCRRSFDFLQEANVRYLVIGGLAVVGIGEPRTTADADVIAFLSDEQAKDLIMQAQSAGFELNPETELERLKTTGTLRFKLGPFQLDIILASLPFEEEAHARATRCKLFGRTVALPSPEDLILFKVLAGRDKDLVDAVGVAKRHHGKLDWTCVEAVIQGLCDQAEDMGPWHRLQIVRSKAQ